MDCRLRPRRSRLVSSSVRNIFKSLANIIAGDMSNDAFNATAQWDIFDINVNIMHENVNTAKFFLLPFHLC